MNYRELKTLFRRIKKKCMNVVRVVAPGLVTGSGDNDPSGIGTYSIAGAQYGLAFGWLMFFLIPLLFVVQEMCGRIGLVTKRGLVASMSSVFSRPLIYFAIIIVSIANIFNIGANIAIMVDCAQLILDHNGIISALLITVMIVFVEILVPYRIYSKILFVFSLFLLAYVATAFMVKQDWWEIILATVVPTFHFDQEFILVLTGVIGTTISPYLFFWQTSQSIEERNGNSHRQSHKAAIKDGKLGVFVGMVFTQLVAFFIIVTTFSTLYRQGLHDINSAADAALALKPFAGEAAMLIFSIGIIGSGFLGISVLAGATAYALSELFHKEEGLSNTFRQAPFFYSVIALSVVLGLLIYAFDLNSVKALFYAAVINGIVSVPILGCTLILANKKVVMGVHKNSTFSNIVGTLTFVLMLFVALYSVSALLLS